ncbi:hypothetical protein MP638_006236 [Amoeboaphelidium occidentale]|nr:hypothetical protein MP638_006236 [Amoeboaphelidium occidentale]
MTEAQTEIDRKPAPLEEIPPIMTKSDAYRLLNERLKQGFVSYKTVAPKEFDIELHKDSKLPKWLRGTLFRIGPGVFEVPYSVVTENEDKSTEWFRFQHWFDSLPLLQKLTLQDDRVTFSAHLTAKGMERKIFARHGLPPYINTWATTSNQSYFASMAVAFSQNTESEMKQLEGDKVCAGDALYSGFPVGGNSSKLVSVASSAPPVVQVLDPVSGEPSGTILPSSFAGQPLKPSFVSPLLAKDSDVFYGCSTEYSIGILSSSCIYHVWRAGPGDSITTLDKITCKIPSAGLVYQVLHTENYIIVPVFPYVPKSGMAASSFVNATAPISQCFAFSYKEPIRFHVLSKKTGKRIITYEVSPNGFGLHGANAFETTEQNGSRSIELDMFIYEDASVIDFFKLDNLRGPVDNNTTSPLLPLSKLTRFRLSNISGAQSDFDKTSTPSVSSAVQSSSLSDMMMELSAINSLFRGKQYQFTYAVSQSKEARASKAKLWDVIVKVDVNTKTVLRQWQDPGSVVTAPTFIPKPNSKQEDEGVIMFQILDCKGPMNVIVDTIHSDVPQSADISDYKIPKADDEQVFDPQELGHALPDTSRPVSAFVILDARSFEQLARIDLPTTMKKTVHSVQNGQQEIDALLSLPPLSFGRGTWLQGI